MRGVIRWAAGSPGMAAFSAFERARFRGPSPERSRPDRGPRSACDGQDSPLCGNVDTLPHRRVDGALMAGDRRRPDALGGETEDECHARGEQRVYELLADGRTDRQQPIESRFAIQSVTMCVRSDRQRARLPGVAPVRAGCVKSDFARWRGARGSVGDDDGPASSIGVPARLDIVWRPSPPARCGGAVGCRDLGSAAARSEHGGGVPEGVGATGGPGRADRLEGLREGLAVRAGAGSVGLVKPQRAADLAGGDSSSRERSGAADRVAVPEFWRPWRTGRCDAEGCLKIGPGCGGRGTVRSGHLGSPRHGGVHPRAVFCQ